jgi:hypothetical protein
MFFGPFKLFEREDNHMIFTLEALQAEQGDSLILHYGSSEQPRFAVIDGGPPGVYEATLKPRLEELHARWKDADKDKKLRLELLMVSHIDDDHISGIIDWVKAMQSGESVPCKIRTYWYNSFPRVR